MDKVPFSSLSSSSFLLDTSSRLLLAVGNSSDKNNKEDGSDPIAQANILLWNIGIGYIPLTALICYAVISHDTRSSLAMLRSTYILGTRKSEAIHGALRLLIGSYILRIGWMGLLSQNFANKLTGPSCYTGIDCGGQIFHSALNRFSALLYFMALCRIGPAVGSAWLDYNPQNLNSVQASLPSQLSTLSSSSSPKFSLFFSSVWIPPILEWDMSLLATDGFLLALQLFLIILSLALPNNVPSYSPIYEAFQFQVATLSALLSLWFLSFGIYVLKEQCSLYRSTNFSTKIKNFSFRKSKDRRDENNVSAYENDSNFSASVNSYDDPIYSSTSKWTWKTKFQNLTKPLSSSSTVMQEEEGTPLLISSSSSTTTTLNTNISSSSPSSTIPLSPPSPRSSRKNSTRNRHTPIYIRPEERSEHSFWSQIAITETTVRETKVWCNRLFCYSDNGTDSNNYSGCSCLYMVNKIPFPAYCTSLTCIFIALLYGLRCPLFLYSSFVSNSTSSWTSYLYPYFYYTIPEILPGLLLIQISMPGGIQNIRKWYDKVY